MSAITSTNATPLAEVDLTRVSENTVNISKAIDSERNTATNDVLTKVVDSNVISNLDVEGRTKQDVISTEQLEKMAQQLQEFVGSMNKSLLFSVDKDSGRDVLKVIDSNNGDIIKQYPSEEILTLVAKLSEAAGTFVNEQV